MARPDLVLLNDDDLAYAKVRLDPASLATCEGPPEGLRRQPAAHPRMGLGLDAARDGETPARGYVELILANIASETDSSVIQTQLRQLATTLTYYVASGAQGCGHGGRR